MKFLYKSFLLGILFFIILVGNVLVWTGTILISLSGNQELKELLNPTLLITSQIYTPITISLTPIFYRAIFKRSHLFLDLEESRQYLIQIFEVESDEPPTIALGETSTTKAKYLRINLRNIGKQTAKNCRIKIFIYYYNFELVQEPTNIYPAGYHHYKIKKELPPLVDIAAGDSQIFDICSTTNITSQTRFVRFEDHFSLSRLEAELHSLNLKIYYIKLIVYSDNNAPIEKRYKIFIDDSIQGLEWQKINIKEYDWEKSKKQKLKANEKKVNINQEEISQRIKNNIRTDVNKTEFNNSDFKGNIYDQYDENNKEKRDFYTTGAKE